MLSRSESLTGISQKKSAYKYWLGIAKLWQWLNKHEEPPVPRKSHSENVHEPILNNTVFKEIPAVIKVARESQNLTIKQLANKSGYEITLIYAGELD
jgi:hypothetical protein